MKFLAYIISFSFLFTIAFGVQGNNRVSILKDKKDKQERIQVSSSHAVVPIAEFKLSLPFEFHFEIVKQFFLEYTPKQYVSRFVDKYLKVLLLCIISPHAP